MTEAIGGRFQKMDPTAAKKEKRKKKKIASEPLWILTNCLSPTEDHEIGRAG